LTEGLNDSNERLTKRCVFVKRESVVFNLIFFNLVTGF
jgi:hypothetical protein